MYVQMRVFGIERVTIDEMKTDKNGHDLSGNKYTSLSTLEAN
jgi:hypothetical protein